jgi:hypothetical protein
MSDVTWPSRPILPVAPATGATPIDFTIYWQKCDILLRTYANDIEAFGIAKAINQYPDISADSHKIRWILDSIISGGLRGAAVLPEAITQLSALNSFLNKPLPIPGPK